MKYLMVFALVCGLSLIAAAEAKEVPVEPAVPVVEPAVPVEVDEVDISLGGDIRVRHLNWSDMLFGYVTETGIEDEAWLETRMRLLMEADLAENVGVVVRLQNERAWGGPLEGEFDVLLDRAYLTMENVADHPVDLIIGRQPIELGDKMQISATFDAVRLSFPFEPVEIDAFFAKVQDAELGLWVPDDDLIGFHIVYLHPEPAITVNMGYYELIDRRVAPDPDDRVRSMALSAEGDIVGLLEDIPGVGALGIDDIGLSVSGGMISQTGEVEGVSLDADALYFEVGAAMDIGAISLRYASLSGDDPATAEWEGFDPMFEGVDFGTVIADELDMNTDLNLWGLGLEAQPMPGVGVSLNYIDLTEDAVPAGVSDDIGTELNLEVKYALAEDVTVGFKMAQLSPGDALAPLGTETSSLMGLGIELGF